MRKAGILCVAAVTILMLTGCKGDDADNKSPVINYSQEAGTVVGTADFSKEEPDISLNSIKAYLGEEIDYSSGVTVTNTEQYEDFQMWVDASGVDIYTVGNYEAVYRFIYDGKTIEKTIMVMVVKRDEELSGDDFNQNYVQGNDGSQGGSTNSTVGGGNENDNGNGGDLNNGSGSGSNSSGNSSNNGNGGNASNGDNNGGNNVNSGGNGNSSDSGSSNSGAGTQAPEETTRRQIVTSSNASNTKPYTLGYMNIELLSGSVVKIKCTSSRYIVSTRTDVSSADKDGVNYKVYKLVVTYNTGVEQVLETYEEKQ